MPILDEENIVVWQIFNVLCSQPRVGGLGTFVGFDLSSLGVLLTAYDIPEIDWAFVLDRIGLLTKIASRYWNTETKNR